MQAQMHSRRLPKSGHDSAPLNTSMEAEYGTRARFVRRPLYDVRPANRDLQSTLLGFSTYVRIAGRESTHPTRGGVYPTTGHEFHQTPKREAPRCPCHMQTVQFPPPPRHQGNEEVPGCRGWRGVVTWPRPGLVLQAPLRSAMQRGAHISDLILHISPFRFQNPDFRFQV